MLIAARELVVGHGAPLLPPLNFEIAKGERWVVVGRNGSGKSTLLRTLLGLIPPLGGAVERRPGAMLSFVPQRHPLGPGLPLRARDVAAEGLEAGWSFMRPLPRARARVDVALARTGAMALADRRFDELSEGQKQRVLLARAIASAPSLVFLDEPTSAMDPVAEAEALTILDGLRAEAGTAVVLVSHHLDAALAAADKALFLDAEHGVVACGSVADVLADATFSRHFGGLVDSHDKGCGDPHHG